MKCPRKVARGICQTCAKSWLNSGNARRCFECIDCDSPMEAIHMNLACAGYERIARCCATCRYDLGGGCCRINLEAECGEGEFEAWEPKELEEGHGPGEWLG